jgi:hypothetical protein
VESSVNPVLAQSSGWRVVVSPDFVYETFGADEVLHASKSAKPSENSGRERHIVVEVYRGVGGIFPRAALGARFLAGGDMLNVSVATIREMHALPTGDFHSLLSTPMSIGLPREFADGIVRGLILDTDEQATPAGDLDVDFAAYDHVNSSPYAFEHVARLLIWTIARQETGEGVDSAAVKHQLDSW